MHHKLTHQFIHYQSQLVLRRVMNWTLFQLIEYTWDRPPSYQRADTSRQPYRLTFIPVSIPIQQTSMPERLEGTHETCGEHTALTKELTIS